MKYRGDQRYSCNMLFINFVRKITGIGMHEVEFKVFDVFMD